MMDLSQYIETDKKGKAQDEFYQEQINEYFADAMSAFKKDMPGCNHVFDYALGMSHMFYEDTWIARMAFERVGLKMIHACAILHEMNDFMEELDKILEDERESSFDI